MPGFVDRPRLPHADGVIMIGKTGPICLRARGTQGITPDGISCASWCGSVNKQKFINCPLPLSGALLLSSRCCSLHPVPSHTMSSIAHPLLSYTLYFSLSLFYSFHPSSSMMSNASGRWHLVSSPLQFVVTSVNGSVTVTCGLFSAKLLISFN